MGFNSAFKGLNTISNMFIMHKQITLDKQYFI